MKTNFKQLAMAAMVAGCGLLAPASLFAAATLTGVTNEWNFSTGSPGSTGAGGNGAIAVVAPGQYASGWLASNDLLGGAQGVWDLGASGVIALNNSSGLGGATDKTRVFTVKVVEWNDGGIYSEPAKVSLPGATLLSSAHNTVGLAKINASASVGGWIVNETKWSAPAGTVVNSAVITGASYGSLVDQVTVQSSAVGGVPVPQLAIKLVGANAVISWASSLGNVTLESTSDLSNLESWSTVSAAVSVVGSVSSVTVQAGDLMRFYRLK